MLNLLLIEHTMAIYINPYVLYWQVERVITIMQNPRQYKIPDWFLNRQKDIKDGKYSQVWEIAFALTRIVKCVCFERLLANFSIFWF